jgi:hypothetical protein
MATTTIWNIAELERHHSLTGLSLLFTTPSDANDGTYSAGAYGSIGLDAPEGNVIPYADLTPEIVIGWVQEKLGGDEKVAESKLPCKHKLISSAHPPRVMACRGRKSQDRHRTIATPAREAQADEAGKWR